MPMCNDEILHWHYIIYREKALAKTVPVRYFIQSFALLKLPLYSNEEAFNIISLSIIKKYKGALKSLVELFCFFLTVELFLTKVTRIGSC